MYEHNGFPAGEPEDGELDLNTVIPKMQARIRELEELVSALVVTHFTRFNYLDVPPFALTSRRLIATRAQHILEGKNE